MQTNNNYVAYINSLAFELVEEQKLTTQLSYHTLATFGKEMIVIVSGNTQVYTKGQQVTDN